MHGKRTTPPADRAIRELAERQHGVVARRQLVRLGVRKGAIEHRIATGRLVRGWQGVYAVGHAPLTAHGHILAAVLACGDKALASHRSAAYLWRIQRSKPAFAEITVPSGSGRKRKGLILHRSSLSEAHRTTLAGIPVTTPGRTLTDYADIATFRQLERAVEEAEHLRLDFDGFEATPGRRGAGRILRMEAKHDDGSTRTRNDFEEAIIALCDAHGLPRPMCNHYVLEWECDCVWPGARLIVELDGWGSHRTRAAFERDRRRDAELTEAGWRVVRYTWRRLTEEPAAVAAQLRRLLSA